MWRTSILAHFVSQQKPPRCRGQAAWVVLRVTNLHLRLAHTTQPNAQSTPGSRLRSCSQVMVRLASPLLTTVPYVFVHLAPNALQRHCSHPGANSLWHAFQELHTSRDTPRLGTEEALPLGLAGASSTPKSDRSRLIVAIYKCVREAGSTETSGLQSRAWWC